MTHPQTLVAPTLNPAEVQIGTAHGPGLYIAPPGTAPPVDTLAPWAAPWAILGYVDEAGPTIAQSTTKNNITPWQSRAPLRAVITERGLTAHFVMWQLNATTLALYFDADPITPAVGPSPPAGSLAFDVVTSDTQHQYAFGLDAADNERVLRIIFPMATLSDSGDMTLTKGTAVPLDVTLSALEQNGVLAHVMLSAPGTGALAADLSREAVGSRSRREPAGVS